MSRSGTRHFGRLNKLIRPLENLNYRPRFQAARLLLAGLLLVFLAGCFLRSPGPEPPIPADLEKLNPQLRAYVADKIEWVRQNPRESKRHATLGLVYAANSLWDPARRAFENAAQLDPEPLAFLYIAISTQELGEYDQAIGLYQALADQFPDFPQAHWRLGDLLLRVGRIEQAGEAFRRVVELAPGEWRGHAGVGEAFFRQGKLEESEEHLKRAVELEPSARIAHHLLGQLLNGLNRKEEAERHLRLGLDAEHFPMPDPWAEEAPQHMKSLPDQVELAQKYLGAGLARGAVDLLESARVWHPDNLKLLTTLARAHTQSGEPVKAREVLQHALKIDPDHLLTWVLFSEACLDLGLMNESRAAVQRALDLGPDTPQAYIARANLHLELEENEQALEAFEKAMQLDPKNALLKLDAGDVCLRLLNRPFQALEHYEQAVRQDPQLVPAHVRLCDIHLRLGRHVEARKAFETARKIDPGEPVLQVLEARLMRSEE